MQSTRECTNCWDSCGSVARIMTCSLMSAKSNFTKDVWYLISATCIVNTYYYQILFDCDDELTTKKWVLSMIWQTVPLSQTKYIYIYTYTCMHLHLRFLLHFFENCALRRKFLWLSLLFKVWEEFFCTFLPSRVF